MSKPHSYRHLDDDRDFRIQMTTRDVAEMVDRMNYGVHRFLSHLVDVRRERLAVNVAKYRANGDHELADAVERSGDALANGIEKLLQDGMR